MTGRRRGRTGRGWDAAPPRTRPSIEDGPFVEGAGDGAGEGLLAENGGEPTTAGRPPARWGRWGSRPGNGATRASGDERPVDPSERAREICLRQLAVRPRTRAELATALRQRGVGDEVAAAVLERYGEVGIIDDSAFARAWVNSRHFGRGLASRALANELRQKGVDAEAVGAALADLDPETEAETARALVDRKLRIDRGGPPEATLRRLVGMLARKGYSPGLAIRVVRDALADRAAAREEEEAEGTDLDELGLDIAADLLESEASSADAETRATLD